VWRSGNQAQEGAHHQALLACSSTHLQFSIFNPPAQRCLRTAWPLPWIRLTAQGNRSASHGSKYTHLRKDVSELLGHALEGALNGLVLAHVQRVDQLADLVVAAVVLLQASGIAGHAWVTVGYRAGKEASAAGAL